MLLPWTEHWAMMTHISIAQCFFALCVHLIWLG